MSLQGLGIKDFKIIKGKYKLELIIHLIHSILTHKKELFWSNLQMLWVLR